jgi:uncharacterized protein
LSDDHRLPAGDEDAPPPARRRPALSIAVWIPVLIGAILAGFLTAFATIGHAAPSFPALTGRVVDEANIIPPAAEQELTAKLAALEAKTGDQFVVVTLKSLQGYDISDYGYQLGRAWGIGQKGKDNGLLLIVAPNERAVRFEVGYGLEGEFTDAAARVIIDQAILPGFRAGDLPAGITRGVDDSIRLITGNAPEIKELAERRPAEDSGANSFMSLLFLIVVLIILFNIFRRNRRGGYAPWIIPGGFSGGNWSRGGSWGGGSGGGFSGGGGSFGGGGASGRW